MTTLTAKCTANSFTHVSHVWQCWFWWSSSLSCLMTSEYTWPISCNTEAMRSRGCNVREALRAITDRSQGNVIPEWCASEWIHTMWWTPRTSSTFFRRACTTSMTKSSLLLQGHIFSVKTKGSGCSRWYSIQHRPSTSHVNIFHSGNTSPLLTTSISNARQAMMEDEQEYRNHWRTQKIIVCSPRRLLTEWLAFGGKMNLPSNHWRRGFRRLGSRLVVLIATSGQFKWLRDGCPSPHHIRKFYWESLFLKAADWSR